FVRLDDIAHIPERERFLGSEEVAGVEQAERRRETDELGQEPAAGPRVGDETAVREVPREARVRRSDPDVALRCELGPHADGGTVDRGDHRLRTLDERPPEVRLLGGATYPARLAGDRAEIGEVRPGAERPAGARDDHDARV